MNEEELDSLDNLYINLEDIDDLDMGLEIISYKVRKTMQDFADTLLKQSFEIQAYKDKEDKLKEYCKVVKRTGRVFENWKDTVDYQIKVANDVLQILNEGDK